MSNSTGAFVIARKQREFLDSPVFRAGPNDEEEAIAIFTSRKLAERYIKLADWQSEYEVGELQPIQVMRWITTAREQGVEMAVINPQREDHLQGQQQSVIYLTEPLEAFADLLSGEFIDRADAAER